MEEADKSPQALPGKCLFGWTNIKWFVREMVATLSGKPSFFSSKRVERCLLFSLGYVVLAVWTFVNMQKLNLGEILAVFGSIMAMVGYNMNTTQKEKKLKKDEDSLNSEAKQQ